MYDLKIKNGKIYTGAGNPWFISDIAVKDGYIAEIGKLHGDAETVIDANGLAVAPGIIDLHDHSDTTILVDREATSKVHMGVSTTTFPSCGTGAAPLNDEMREKKRRQEPFLVESGIDISWSTVEEYLEFLESDGLSINVAPLVGFGSVREYVMGMEMRAPTPDELQRMKEEIETAMKAGCR